MRELFALVGKISIEGAAEFTKKMNDFDKEARKLERSINRFGKEVSKVGSNLTSLVSGPILAIGAGFGIAAKKTAEWGDGLSDLVEITGLSTDTLQEFQHVANIAGVSFEGLVSATTKLTNQLPEIAKGTGAGADAMKRLGINLYNVDGSFRSMNELFPEILKSLMAMENVTERNATAQDVFGRSLTDVAPLLGMTAEELDNTRKQAHELGLVMSKEGVDAAAKFNASMNVLKSEFAAVVRQMVVDFIPVLQDTILPLIRQQIIPIIQSLGKSIKGLAEWFNGLSPTMQKVVLSITAFAAVSGPALLAFGKILSVVKILAPAFVLLKTAVLAFNVALMSNPFLLAAVAVVTLTGAVMGAVGAYQKLNKERMIHTTVVTEEKAKIDEFIVSTDALIKKIQQHGKVTGGAEEAEKLFGDEIARSTELARAMGVTVEGDAIQKIKILADTLIKAKGNTAELGKGFRSLGETSKTAADGIKQVSAASAEMIQKQKDWAREWSDKIALINADELEASKIRERQAIESAQREGQSVIEVKRYYTEEQKKIVADTLTAINENIAKAEEEKAEIEAKIAENKKEEQLVIDEAEAERVQQQKQDQEDLKEKRQETFDEWLMAAADTINGIGALSQMATENEMARIDQRAAKDKARIMMSVMNEEQKAAEINKIDQKTDKEKRKLIREQAKREKALGIFGAIINTALGISKALSSLPPPLSFVMAAITGVLGAVQIGLIAAQPLPALAKGGYVKRQDGGVTAVIGEGKEDELVLPMKTGVEQLADNLTQKIREAENVRGRIGREVLGGGNSVNNSNTVNLQIGTLVADDAGLKELEQRMYGVRVLEQQRRGL